MAALSALVTLPPFLVRYEMIGNMWVFVGSPGYGAHLHLDDDLDTNTWQAQVGGNLCYASTRLSFFAKLHMITDQVFPPESM